MRLKLVAVLSALSFSASLAQAVEIDRNMVAKEFGVVNHPALAVISFLKGDWVAKNPVPSELSFTAPGNLTMIGSKRTIREKKLEIQITVLKGGSHGFHGLTRKLDDQLSPIGPPITQSLSVYGPRFASFSFGEASDKKTISYEVTEKNVLLVKEQNTDGTSVEVTEFSKVD